MGRRLLTLLLPLGESTALMLNRFGIFVQKIANTIRFEHFWKRHVASNPETIIVPSFTQSRSKHPIWDIATSHARAFGDTGTVLEFGTNNGGSLLYLRNHLPHTMILHGFDCFEGIPEPWDSLPKGAIKGFGYPSELWVDHAGLRPGIEAEVKGISPSPRKTIYEFTKGCLRIPCHRSCLPECLRTSV